MMKAVKNRRSEELQRHEQVARLEALYQSDYEVMVRLAFTLISNRAEAEELVQDSFLDVFRRLERVRDPKYYLRRAVVNRCRSTLRRRQVASARRPDPPGSLPPAAMELWDVLNKLPIEHRIAVVLRYYGGLRATEIATIVDRPAATVRSHLHRGLAQLRRELSS